MKTAMQLMEELELHEGGVENWIPGNAWETFADLIRADAMETATRAANESWTLMCKKMVELEREACASVVDKRLKFWATSVGEDKAYKWLKNLSEIIRARGNT